MFFEKNNHFIDAYMPECTGKNINENHYGSNLDYISFISLA